jgi:hypothetical protein
MSSILRTLVALRSDFSGACAVHLEKSTFFDSMAGPARQSRTASPDVSSDVFHRHVGDGRSRSSISKTQRFAPRSYWESECLMIMASAGCPGVRDRIRDVLLAGEVRRSRAINVNRTNDLHALREPD